MTVQSPWFPLFTAALLVIYYRVPGQWQWRVLLTGSGCFYLWAGKAYLGFLLLTLVSTYLAARQMGDGQGREDRKKRRPWLILCLTVNASALMLCKSCLLPGAKELLAGSRVEFLTLGLPLGISFYTLQTMGYLIDVYRGTVEPERNFGKFSLFAAWFPQLIQGPVSGFSQLGPQLTAAHPYDGQRLSFGAQRVLWGYFKKLVIADRLAPAVTALRQEQTVGGGFLVLTILYAVQLYGDFTGGVDIALGVSECFGIRLPENFRHPFFAKNTAQYWRRWHMTLGTWMKTYVFYPVSVSAPVRRLSRWARARLGGFGKRVGVYLATGVTWLATGVWHGLTPNFLVWGMLNCLVIVLSQELTPLYRRFHSRFGWKDKPWYGVFEGIRMFLLMNLIRACDLYADPREYFHRLLSLFSVPLWRQPVPALGLTGADWGILALGIGAMLLVSLLQQRAGSLRQLLWRGNPWLRYGLTFLLLVAVLLFGRYGVGYEGANFIYSQF